jgi:hypothetical protein
MSEALDRRRQWLAFGALSFAALGLTLVLLPSSKADFQRFFGRADPILVVLVASIAAAAALGALQARDGFEILKGRGTLRGMAVSAGLATLFAVAIVIADFIIRYPETINIPVPRALLFYPAVGFIAEIVFHVLPLAVLMWILAPFSRRFRSDRIVWLGIILVAVLEPSFHVMSEGKALSWASAYTWVHVFSFSVFQLVVFRRYDFMSMFSLRLFYYAYWHIVWGMIRLKVLF